VVVGVEAVGETPVAGSRSQTPQKNSVQLSAVNYDSTPFSYQHKNITSRKKIIGRKAQRTVVRKVKGFTKGLKKKRDRERALPEQEELLKVRLQSFGIA
jgi:hypothetical protein